MAEDLNKGLAKPLELGTGEAAGCAARPNSGAKKALIGVDVTNSGEQLLVKEGSLDGKFAPAKEGDKFLGADREWFRPGTAEGGIAAQIAELESSETAGIDKTQFAATG